MPGGPTSKPDPAAWGLPDFSFQRLSGGNRNRVLRGQGKGADYVFKSTRRSQEALSWLWDLAPHLQSAGLTRVLPVPTVDGLPSHNGWTMEKYVPGRAMTRADFARLSMTLRRLQRICYAFPQRPGFASARELLHHTTSGDIDLEGMPFAIVARCRAALSLVPSTPLTLVHGDLNYSNLAVNRLGQFLIYDWDEARIDHPLFDMVAIGGIGHTIPRRAALAYEVFACWHHEPERAMSLAKLL